MGLLQEFAFNESDIITTDRFLNSTINIPQIIYIKTDFLYNQRKFIWRNKSHPDVKRFNSAHIAIVGHSDYAFIKEYAERFKRIKQWFVVNNHTTLPNVISLPLGVTNDCDDSQRHRLFGNNTLIMNAIRRPKNPIHLVYMNFNLITYPSERNYVYNMFANKPWVKTGQHKDTKECRQAFLNDIYDSKFCICPRGNGLDTHRLWETLYLKTFPIVIFHSHFANMTDLPILFINSWDEVTEEFLIHKYEEMSNTEYNLDKLKVSYWISLFKSAI